MIDKKKSQEIFYERLRHLMEEKGLSQTEIAKIIGVTPQAISRWNARVAMPDVYNFKQLASFFDVSQDYLYGCSDVKHSDNQTLADTLGLSDEAIDALQKFKKQDELIPINEFKTSELLSEIIGHKDFLKFVEKLPKSATHYFIYFIEKQKEKPDNSIVKKQQELCGFYKFEALEIMGEIIFDIHEIMHNRYSQS